MMGVVMKGWNVMDLPVMEKIKRVRLLEVARS